MPPAPHRTHRVYMHGGGQPPSDKGLTSAAAPPMQVGCKLPSDNRGDFCFVEQEVMLIRDLTRRHSWQERHRLPMLVGMCMPGGFCQPRLGGGPLPTKGAKCSRPQIRGGHPATCCCSVDAHEHAQVHLQGAPHRCLHPDLVHV